MNEKLSTQEIKPLRCLVLGGRGFIGSHLVEALLAQGYLIKVFGRPNSSAFDRKSTSNIEILEGDITSEVDIAAAIVDCDICFHLVSTVVPKSSNLNPVFDIETNLISSVRLLHHAVKSGLKKIIFLSSGGTVYGNPIYTPIDEIHPTNPICSYGITKLAIEKYLSLYHELYGLDYVVLRLSNPFGERQRIQANQGAIAVFLGKITRDEPVEIWGNGSVVRDYIHVSDVVSAMIKSIGYHGSEHLFNIGSGHGISINDVLDGIENVTGKTIVRNYTIGRSFDVPTNVLDISRATTLLQWQPKISFMVGLKRMIDWIYCNKNN
jgi:UDP-glucose 4-epimerase